MRFLLVLVITVSVLLAFGLACADDEKEAHVIPSPASQFEGGGDGEEKEAEEADAEPEAADEGELREDCLDSDMDMVCDDDGVSDADEADYGSDPLDDASVLETDLINDGSCADGVDNDGDGFIDFADNLCR